MIDVSGRHPATQNLARWLAPNPNLPVALQEVAMRVEHTASLMIRDFSDGPELSEGLRHLLYAKDCFVRAAIATGDEAPE